MKKLFPHSILIVLFTIGCNNELLEKSELVEVESLGLDYSIISSAYINSKIQNNKSLIKFGFHSRLETEMINYLDTKFPDKDYKSVYDELLTSQKIKNLSYERFSQARLNETYDLHQNIYDLQLSEPAETYLINLTYAFDNRIDDLEEVYVEQEAIEYINNELNVMKSSIVNDPSIPYSEKQLLIEAIDAYSVNIPFLLDEFSTYGTVNGRWLRKFLRQVVTVVVNVAVGVVTGWAVSGGNPIGAIVGGVVGLGVGIYMIANNECYAFDRCQSGRMSCETGACY
jgi:hypothetical protein